MRFRFILLVIGIIYITAFFYYKRWPVNIAVGGDGWGYYAYLPALFLYGDIGDMRNTYLARFNYVKDEKPTLPGRGDVLTLADNGHYVNKYTSGVAIMELPFFLIGHLAAVVLGYPRDGYSTPYVFWIHLANLFYFFLGLPLLFKVLRSEVGPKIAGLTILAVTLGSIVFHFEVFRGPMAHSYLFSLYCLLIYATWQFYRSPAKNTALMIGFSAGMITLIRPVEFVCLAIPLFYGLGMERNLKTQWLVLRSNIKLIGLAAASFVLCGLIQMLYWKISSGHWLFYSYGEERFYFSRPKIGPGLFGFQNGWLPYSPVMILSLFGLIYLARQRNWLIPVLVFFPLHVYFAYSWWCGYYINEIGSRPMVEAAPLLAFPIAWFLHYNLRQWGMKILVSAFIVFCIALNIFQTWQHARGILWPEFGKAGYYWSTFGKTKMDKSILIAFDSGEIQPDTSRLAMTGVPIWKDFEIPGPDSAYVIHPGVFNSEHGLKLVPGTGNDLFPLVDRQLYEMGVQAGDYVRIKAWCKKDVKEFPWYLMPSFFCRLDKKGKPVKTIRVRIDNKLDNPESSLWGGKSGEWGLVDFYYRIPIDARENDKLQVYVELQQQPVYVDDFAVEVWKNKPKAE